MGPIENEDALLEAVNSGRREAKDAFGNDEIYSEKLVKRAPQTTSGTGKSHKAGCSCCSGKSSRMTYRHKDGSKTFPKSRPWMISY